MFRQAGDNTYKAFLTSKQMIELIEWMEVGDRHQYCSFRFSISNVCAPDYTLLPYGVSVSFLDDELERDLHLLFKLTWVSNGNFG